MLIFSQYQTESELLIQKKSTPKNYLSQTILVLLNNSVSANYSNIHLWFEKSKYS